MGGVGAAVPQGMTAVLWRPLDSRRLRRKMKALGGETTGGERGERRREETTGGERRRDEVCEAT